MTIIRNIQFKNNYVHSRIVQISFLHRQVARYPRTETDYFLNYYSNFFNI